MIRVAFDIDGTLIHQEGTDYIPDTPRYEILAILFFLHATDNCEVYVWSGGGIDYATRWAEKLGLSNFVEVIEKGQLINGEQVDIAVDDEHTTLGKVNIKV